MSSTCSRDYSFSQCNLTKVILLTMCMAEKKKSHATQPLKYKADGLLNGIGFVLPTLIPHSSL